MPFLVHFTFIYQGKIQNDTLHQRKQRGTNNIILKNDLNKKIYYNKKCLLKKVSK